MKINKDLYYMIYDADHNLIADIKNGKIRLNIDREESGSIIAMPSDKPTIVQ